MVKLFSVLSALLLATPALSSDWTRVNQYAVQHLSTDGEFEELTTMPIRGGDQQYWWVHCEDKVISNNTVYDDKRFVDDSWKPIMRGSREYSWFSVVCK